jgi:hypothetical protein
MEKVHKAGEFRCEIPLSEPYRIVFKQFFNKIEH